MFFFSRTRNTQTPRQNTKKEKSKIKGMFFSVVPVGLRRQRDAVRSRLELGVKFDAPGRGSDIRDRVRDEIGSTHHRAAARMHFFGRGRGLLVRLWRVKSWKESGGSAERTRVLR